MADHPVAPTASPGGQIARLTSAGSEFASGSVSGTHGTDPLAQGSKAADLDELVDRVVARIEQRVVDELERRGRRHNPGAF
ncbi:MAG TPA: hypothetical protein VGH11_17970 [Jatrophihabitans sp.]|jgi:hypothetical protein